MLLIWFEILHNNEAQKASLTSYFSLFRHYAFEVFFLKLKNDHSNILHLIN